MAKEFTITFPEDQFHTLANLLQLIVVAGLRLHGTGNAIPTNEALSAVWNTIIKASLSSATGQGNNELEFLRFFHHKIQPYLGPGSGDVIRSLIQEYKEKTKKKLPEGYYDEDQG